MNLNYESGKVGDYKGTPVYTIEEITLSAGIDDYIQSQLNRDWLGEIS